MKRKNNNKLEDSNSVLKKIKKTDPNFGYFLPQNTGLVYTKIVAYRVILGQKEDYEQISDFYTLIEAQNYLKTLANTSTYSLIRAIVLQNEFYLEKKDGSIKDTRTNKKYICINKSRYSEWDLDNLNNCPLFEL